MPQRDWELEQDFPGLAQAGYTKTSDRDPNYNCVAWAVGNTKRYWYDAKIKGYYWPPLMPSADTLEGWLEVFKLHGYRETDEADLERGYEKVAIYVTSEGFPEHVARQKSSGAWSSKMGKGIDIEHPTLAGLEGDLIGRVTVIMKRRIKGGKRVFE
jgi:hypothetical protein